MSAENSREIDRAKTESSHARRVRAMAACKVPFSTGVGQVCRTPGTCCTQARRVPASAFVLLNISVDVAGRCRRLLQGTP